MGNMQEKGKKKNVNKRMAYSYLAKKKKCRFIFQRYYVALPRQQQTHQTPKKRVSCGDVRLPTRVSG